MLMAVMWRSRRAASGNTCAAAVAVAGIQIFTQQLVLMVRHKVLTPAHSGHMSIVESKRSSSNEFQNIGPDVRFLPRSSS